MRSVRQFRMQVKNPKTCDEVFGKLVAEGVAPDALFINPVTVP